VVLKSTESFPTDRRYVLKLHRDCVAGSGQLIGRLEHLASGEQFDFRTGQELVAWVLAHNEELCRAAGSTAAPPE
jgi:hypothetical protein